jgi:hypothetical protein
MPPIKTPPLANTGPALFWNRAHFYNNFEISRLALWRSPAYRKLFEALDDRGGFFFFFSFPLSILRLP